MRPCEVLITVLKLKYLNNVPKINVPEIIGKAMLEDNWLSLK